MEKKVIKYEFCDGTVQEHEVNDELYAVHEQLVKEEKRNHWRNTRRHVSLDYLNTFEIDIEAPDGDPLQKLIRQEESAAARKNLAILSDKQRELAEKVFIDGMTMTEISQQENVSQQAISQRIATIIKKIKKLF